MTYGQTFPIATPDAAGIAAVNWIRLGSVTHAFNQNQRINRLSFSLSGGTLNVTAPASANLCPPGDYMLFLLNAAGVPSVAHMIRIAPAVLQIATVAPNVGRTSGGQSIQLTGNFAGLATVTVGGATAAWSFGNGTGTIDVTTPAHALGAVSIEVTPHWGSAQTKPHAFAFLPTTFTDDLLVAGATAVKAQHLIELRLSVEALRLVAGLSAPGWTDPALGSMPTAVKAAHIVQLRTYFEEAATALGYPAGTYTDTPLQAGTIIRRPHIEELRQRIRELAQ